MSLEVSGLDGIPSWVEQVVKPLLPHYVKEIGKHEAWLERKGREAVRAAAGSLASKAAPKAVERKLPKPPDLIAQVVGPVLEPLLRGAKAEAWRIGRPILVGIVILSAGTLAGSFALGRATARRKFLTDRQAVV